MASRFNQHLNTIANRITIRDEDRETFTQDFDVIRDYLFNIMRKTDVVFKQICKGPSLFGSYSNNVRICYPNEFDVHILLSFPFSSFINIEEDEDRPGFVNLDFSDVMDELYDANGYVDVYNLLYNNIVDSYNGYLRRSNLQRWITDIIEEALDSYGTNIRGASGISYKLEYSKRGLAHTIYAHAQGYDHNISMDFVPAIMFGQAEWMDLHNFHPFSFKCERWYAVPKPIKGPKGTRKYAFMICCPKVEHDLLLGRQNLKVVFRLLKSLRNAYGLSRLKSYFLTTIFLWEIETQNDDYWHQPLSVLLVHMLDVLYEYFNDGSLPFFWNPNLDLLDILSEYEIEYYAEKLRKAYNTLISYHHQPRLSYASVLKHFEIPEGR